MPTLHKCNVEVIFLLGTALQNMACFNILVHAYDESISVSHEKTSESICIHYGFFYFN